MSIYHKSYRCCFVPLCPNTTKTSPDKLFFCVPVNKKIRALWFRIVRRKGEPTKSHFFCCEDHFNVHDDMENFTRFSFMGGRAKLKPSVIPHIFNCQSDIREVSSEKRPWEGKRRRKNRMEDILSEDEYSRESSDLEFEENRASNITRHYRHAVFFKNPTSLSSSASSSLSSSSSEDSTIKTFLKSELIIDEDACSDEVDPLQLPEIKDCEHQPLCDHDQVYLSNVNGGVVL